MSSLVRNYTETKDQAQELLLQGRLQVLLRRLGWCYAALWTLNPQTRLLEWKRGHFQMDTWLGPPVWNRQQSCTAYKSCSFAPGAGFIGRAYLEGRPMWFSGDSVCQSAGSLQQSQFLRDAHIQTVMVIPWLDSILELGTTNLQVREEVELMDRIQEVMSHDLLSVLPDDIDAAVGFDHIPDSNASNSSSPLLLFNQVSSTTSRPPKKPSAAAMTTTTTTTTSLPDDGAAVSRSSFPSAFENLSDQVWRSDIFMQEQGPHNNIAVATTSSGSNGSSQEVNINYNSRKMNSPSTSNFEFSCKTSPVRTTAADQLHQQFNLHGTPISDSSRPDRASTSSGKQFESSAYVGGRNTAEASATAGSTRTSTPYHHHHHHQSTSTTHQSSLRRTTSCIDQYEIQKAISLLETTTQSDDVDAVENHWRLQLQVEHQSQLNNNNSNAAGPVASTSRPQQPAVDLAGFSFPSWPHQQQQQVRSSADFNLVNLKQESGPPLNLRRRHTFSAMEVLKEVDAYHQQQEAATSAPNVEVYDDFNYFDPPAPMESNLMARCRGRSRMMPGSSSSSVLHTSHSEAAVNHMLAERQRRCKQKDNFATLRRLVPIISKGDKTSTLIDAIAYLKDLQNTIVHLEENKEDMDQRIERLTNKCMELEEQNKQLVGVLSGGKLGNTHLLNHLDR